MSECTTISNSYENRKIIDTSSTYRDVFEGLFEGESHASADNQRVDLVQHVLDQLNFVRDLGTTEDGQEGTFGVLEGLCEIFEFLLHEETGSTLGELNSDHTRVSTVSGTESIVDVDITELGETFPEFSDLSGVSLDLVTLLVLGRALLFDVETQVLEKDDGAGGGFIDGLFDFGAN